MISYTALDNIRQEVENPRLDDVAKDLTRSLYEELTQICERLSIRATIFNNGSTDPSRLTHVLDPTSRYRPFPPDVDLNIVADQNSVSAELWQALIEPIAGRTSYKRDHSHSKDIFVWSIGSFNVSLAVYSHSAFPGKRLIYVDDYRPTDDERREIKALKLIFQRHGIYGGFNRGISGIAVEEMVRQYGGIEECFDFMRACIDRRKNRVLNLNGRNLLHNVSRHMWKRVKDLLETYDRIESVKATSFEMEDWQRWNAERADLTTTLECSPPSCGREGSDLAKIVRQTAQRLKVLKGLDFFIVPHQGESSDKHLPHTIVYAGRTLSEPGDFSIERSFIDALLERQRD